MSSSKKLTAQDETGIILQRYNPAQAHNLIYTYDELKEIGIKPDFLLALLEVFENAESFEPSKFDVFSISELVDYIRKTHSYYVNKKLPEIEQSIHVLAQAYPDTHPLLLLLRAFYTDYTRHLVTHIEIEERDLLPYISQLETSTAKKPPSLSIQDFINQHHDTEKDLEDVRNTILHYSPPAEQQTPYRILLSQLQVLEKDLAVHALIEDQVLLPRALAIESGLNNP